MKSSNERVRWTGPRSIPNAVRELDRSLDFLSEPIRMGKISMRSIASIVKGLKKTTCGIYICIIMKSTPISGVAWRLFFFFFFFDFDFDFDFFFLKINCCPTRECPMMTSEPEVRNVARKSVFHVNG